MLIREKLNLSETIAISLGIVGTMMLTMPQWFLFLNLDPVAIQKRLDGDLSKYGNYFLGITMALTSSALDVLNYYIIRKVGVKVPASIIPFISGVCTSTVLILYSLVWDPFDFTYFFRDFASDPSIAVDQLQMMENERDRLKEAVVLAIIGATGGWVAIQSMIIGIRMSKSAIASYAEQMGVVVPYSVDVLAFGRQFLKTDGIGLLLIVTLQAYQGYSSLKKTEGEIEKDQNTQKGESLLSEKKIVDSDEKINQSETKDGFTRI
jgi:drug/metabolite transporter (DMT)-like permease